MNAPLGNIDDECMLQKSSPMKYNIVTPEHPRVLIEPYSDEEAEDMEIFDELDFDVEV